ncbi:SAV_915 family protein [Kribbella sp.]|uniref:SAV_915 family protein n=1 Tax=Kribbella sp. TaxID=1871183 RepID=UPI002D7899E5|nr:SAV_915 family protein [Kribbella sp.]
MDEPVPLFVPTRMAGAWDVVALQIGRRPDGLRVGIAFSSLELLRAASGPRQDWVRMHEDSLRETLAELGVTVIQFDPVLVGADVGASAPELVGSHGRRAA